MIKNEYLKKLYMYNDRDIALSQLIEYFSIKDEEFVDSIMNDFPDLEECTKEEFEFLTAASAIIDYFMQINNLNVPSWVRDSRLNFDFSIYCNNNLNKFKS